MKFATKAIHAGQEADPATGATIVPIYQTSTFTQAAIGVNKGYEYSRSGNPTRRALEVCVASLENGKWGLAFASGMAANMAVASLLRPGDHVVSAQDIYGGTYRMFAGILEPMGIAVTYVDGADPQSAATAIRPETKLMWLETPSNPLLRLTDIAAMAAIAKKAGVPVVVDNTFATPAGQNPLDMDADIVVHSTTKYINGHSDVVGGMVVVNDPSLRKRLAFYQNGAGAVPGPFDAWLTLRGVKTLALRMRAHCANAQIIAEILEKHPRVKAVHYPGLVSHPQHALAKRQMRFFGGMISFEIDGGRDAVQAVISKLKLFSLAESLGGVESLVSYPAAMTHASIPEPERLARGIGNGLIRLSVGIEDADDLREDILQALA